METKRIKAELEPGDDPGSVTLYAAAFGNTDRAGEVIEPGAFKNLDEFAASGWIAVNHEWDDLPVASIESATQDGKGLKIVARWHSTDEAQDCRTIVKERLERGKAVKCSIGYRVLEDATEERNGETVRVLKSIELYEASIVNLPANPRAEVVGVKHWAAGLDEAFAALKSGRVISKRNRDRLCKCRDMMGEAHKELHALLEETDLMPDPDEGEGKSVPDPAPEPTPVGESKGLSEVDCLHLKFLELCSTLPTGD